MVDVDRDFEVTFLPADPPRAGRLLCYRADGGLPPDLSGEVQEIRVIANAEGDLCAVRALACQPGKVGEGLLFTGVGMRSRQVWARAARKALELIARGCVVPGLDTAGHAAWRIAGLSGADDAWLHRLADAMPIAGFAVPDTAGRLPDPYRLVRAFLDAVADTRLRDTVTPNAGQHPFNTVPPAKATTFGRAAERLAHGRDDGLGLALILDADGYYPKLHATWYDRREPARLAAADEADDRTPDLRGHLADIGRRLSWAALAEAPHHYGGPVDIYLEEEDLVFLFDRGGDAALAGMGVDMRYPAPLTRGIDRTLTITDSTEAADPRGTFTLNRRPAFTWRVRVGERELTDDELARLTETSSPLVQLDDRLVLLDTVQRRQLRTRLDRPTPLEAIAASLTGSVRLADHEVPVTAGGAVAALRNHLRAVGTNRRIAPPADLKGTLRNYQLHGLAWLTGLAGLGFGALLADDMGLGKTITLIAHHLHRQGDAALAAPTLVVCPGTLLANWEAELRRFAPATPHRRFHGPRRSLDGIEQGEVVLTTYGTLSRSVERLAAIEWGLVCADEAQAAKNPASGAAKALRRIETGMRVAMTGTPVENNLTDLWALLDWATPGLLGTRQAFRATYGRAAEQGDRETAVRLGALVRPFMLRRRKTDPVIAPELPAKTITDQYTALSPEQQALYRRVVDEEMQRVREADGIERRGRVLAMLTRLKQVCNHPAHYLGTGDLAAGQSGKLDLLDELLATVLAEGQQALVFTQYVAMAELLTAHLEQRGTAAAIVHGNTSIRGRERIVAEFQDGRHPVLVLSLKTAGTGLNLTAASHVIHYDRWWNPAVEDQASDRAHRIGQTQPVQIHRLICEGTLEERIAALLEEKRDLAEAVIGAGEAALTELSDEQLLDLIRLERQ